MWGSDESEEEEEEEQQTKGEDEEEAFGLLRDGQADLPEDAADRRREKRRLKRMKKRHLQRLQQLVQGRTEPSTADSEKEKPSGLTEPEEDGEEIKESKMITGTKREQKRLVPNISGESLEIVRKMIMETCARIDRLRAEPG